MRFTNNEIVFLTSVGRGNVPFGIRCRMPQEGKREEYITETLCSLAKKGILDEEEKLTKEGAAIIRFWELYRNCHRHIIVNRIRAAVLDDGKLITVCKDGEEYEVCCMDSATLMLSILKQSDYLRMGEEKPERGKWRTIGAKEWKKEIEEMEGFIPVIEYEKTTLISRKIFYWKEQEGYLLNPERMRIRRLSPAVMRRQIFTILGGMENE